MEEDISASIYVRNKNNVWINDSRVSHCQNCKKEFSFFIRKHHCRNCGNVFCYKCSNFNIVIPDFVTDRPDPADYWNLSFYVYSNKNNEEKVCEFCFCDIQSKIKSHNKNYRIT